MSMDPRDSVKEQLGGQMETLETVVVVVHFLPPPVTLLSRCPARRVVSNGLSKQMPARPAPGAKRVDDEHFVST